MIEEAKRLRSRPTMELFGHQAVFQDPPIRFSASNAYNRLSHDDFAYRIGMIRLENTRLPHVGADRSASQHAHRNSTEIFLLLLVTAAAFVIIRGEWAAEAQRQTEVA